MKVFMGQDFLLESPTAERLYHDYAAKMPIFDFHCHLSPQEIYENKSLNNLTEAWLGGDHYKWRLMRAAGIEEKYITGDASVTERFEAYATALRQAIGNPLYHWSHLELQRFFDIYDPLTPDNAIEVYEEASEKLTEESWYPRSLITGSNVKGVFTTDDPADDLAWHKKLREDESFEPFVLPAFRPDKYLAVDSPDYAENVKRLSDAAGVQIKDFTSLCEALDKRIEYFAENGCHASDQALSNYHYVEASDAELNRSMTQALAGAKLSEQHKNALITGILVHLGRKYHAQGWPMELHIQVVRNNNSLMREQVGVDAGFDSILDGNVALAMNQLLNALAKTEQLPPVILFSLNPADLPILATVAGNFQEGPLPGKVQLGTAWWHLDNLEGMEQQIHEFARSGALGSFVGMLTDSRSFLSYPRHEYFRRILCNYLGDQIERGLYPNDIEFVGKMVEDICFNNAMRYFKMEESM